MTKRARPRYGEGRVALLRAAVKVVANGGLRKLTYRAVAIEAGVTHGLVAHHFGSRDALLREAFEWSLEQSLANSELESNARSLTEFASHLADSVAAEPEVQLFQYELLLESRRTPDLKEYAEILYARYRDSTARELGRLGIERRDISDAAFAALEGLVFQQAVLDDRTITERGVESLRELLSSQVAGASTS